MITEDYVSFETAKLLKEKGFDAKCRYVYLDTGMRVASQIFMEGESSVNYDDIESVAKYNDWITYTQGDFAFLCPTIYATMKWLRETHGLHIDIFPDGNKYLSLIWTVPPKRDFNNLDGKYEDKSYASYEKACEAAIIYCLENLI